ncbi:hypothetical protein [Echinicola pacifica]|nr:hypothetical protein [Echinicola pacifica]
MIPFLPYHSEVLVSSMSCGEVITRLGAFTREIDYLSQPLRAQSEDHVFNGKVSKDDFRLSLVIHKADSFLPLIKGRIESSRAGCIIFLDYSLFPGSAFFLAFWSVVTLIMALFFFFAAGEPTFAGISLAVGIGNVAFAWSHFQRKVRQSQRIFHKMLSLQKNT